MYGQIKYPIYHQSKLFDTIAIKIGTLPIIYCPVCGCISSVKEIGENLRESCLCTGCGSINRQRQLALVLCTAISTLTEHKKIRSLREVARLHDIAVYNTESAGTIHNALSGMENYVCSEFLGPDKKSGEKIKGILHQDIMNLSFNDSTFDIVLSADILEHVPNPYKAHAEIHRVLKPNGRHIFTVPFYQNEFLDEQRAINEENGTYVFLKEPIYHVDPLRPEGILVYTIFSLQMLVELRRIGFRTHFYLLYRPWNGILGSNAIVFEAIKL